MNYLWYFAFFGWNLTPFSLAGDAAHLAAIAILLVKLISTRSARGISLKTQALYLAVFLCRYLDLFTRLVSLYNTLFKCIFLATSAATVFLIRVKHRGSYEPAQDAVPVWLLAAPCALLALVCNYAMEPLELLWAFSIYLEAVAAVPQLHMLLKAGAAERAVVSYLAALALYRALYLPNWYLKYIDLRVVDPIAVWAGVVQTSIFAVFFGVWLTRPALELPTTAAPADAKQAGAGLVDSAKKAVGGWTERLVFITASPNDREILLEAGCAAEVLFDARAMDVDGSEKADDTTAGEAV